MKLLPPKYNALLLATFTAIPIALGTIWNRVDLVSTIGITIGGMVGMNAAYSLGGEGMRAKQYDERYDTVLEKSMAAGFLMMVFAVVGYTGYRTVSAGSIPGAEFALLPIVGIGTVLAVSLGVELRHRLGV